MMKKKNKAEEVRNLLDDIRKRHEADIVNAKKKIVELNESLTDLDDKLQTSLENEDEEEYSNISKEIRKNQDKINMYNNIIKRPLITKKRGDKVLNELVESESKIAKDFDDYIAKELTQMYFRLLILRDEVQAHEEMILKWTAQYNPQYYERTFMHYSTAKTSDFAPDIFERFDVNISSPYYPIKLKAKELYEKAKNDK